MISTNEPTPQTEKPSATALPQVFKRFVLVLIFSVAFGYIEAAVVVYLRTIFYPEGFEFPLSGFGLTPLWRNLLLTEVMREAASLVLILTAARVMGRGLREQFAFFMSMFAVWDIFYYIWLKVLIDWPGSIMDWDILFLIPIAWASPVLAPVLVSITLLIFGLLILYRGACGRPITAKLTDWLGFVAAASVVIISLCTAGPHISNSEYQCYFYWPLFAAGLSASIALFVKCWFNSAGKEQVSGRHRQAEKS